MKQFALMLAVCIVSTFVSVAQYHLIDKFPVKGDDKWDYISVCPFNNNIYIAHGTDVAVLDKHSGKQVGTISNTLGVHGIAFAFGKGFTSNGKLNTVTVFDLTDNKELTQIKVGDNPDAILYEPFSQKIIVCNGRSKDITVIDPVNNIVVHRIALDGKPETAVTDNAGNLYVNLEDKNEIAVVDLRHFMVKDRFSLEKGEGPTGLAIDTRTKRLFSGCDGQLYILNAENGKVVAHMPIGDGCDGVAFDNNTHLIFTANGIGNMNVIQEVDADKYLPKEIVKTERGARTIALDEQTHLIYIPCAQLDGNSTDKRGRGGILPASFHVLVLGR